MRLLLDSCLSGALKGPLTDAGHDVIWSGDWPNDPGDEEILMRAHAERRVLITLDKDFGNLRSFVEFRTAVSFGWPAFA